MFRRGARPCRSRVQAVFGTCIAIAWIPLLTTCSSTEKLDGRRREMAELRNALVSVYYRAARIEGNDEPFLSLGDAVDILVADRSTALAESRRIRAAARLAGASDFSQTDQGVVIEPAEFADAMVALVGEDRVGQIGDLIVARADGGRRGGAPPGDRGEAPRASGEAEFAEENQLIAQAVLGSGIPDCNPSPGVPEVWTEKDTQIASVQVGFTIDKPLDEIAMFLDPRGWAQCSDFFFDVFIAQKESNGEIDWAGPCSANEETGLGSGLGTSWVDFVYERFEPGFGTDTYFQNVLLIEADRQPKSYEMEFALYKSTCSMIIPPEKKVVLGGVEVDWGGARATEDTGNPNLTHVHALKRLRFATRPAVKYHDLRSWTVLTLQVLGEEMPAATCCPDHP